MLDFTKLEQQHQQVSQFNSGEWCGRARSFSDACRRMYASPSMNDGHVCARCVIMLRQDTYKDSMPYKHMDVRGLLLGDPRLYFRRSSVELLG